jgi:hypothetical protein
MAGVEWMIKGREFANCNCAYGCPCQAEYGRGWSKTSGPIAMELGDSHAHFCNLHLTGAGVVR